MVDMEEKLRDMDQMQIGVSVLSHGLPLGPDVLGGEEADEWAMRILDRYVTFWEQADIPGLVALLREDAWFQGRAAIVTVLATRIFPPGRQWRLLPARANGSPAFGLYRRDAGTGAYQLFGLAVLGVVGEQIGSLVAFLELSSLSSFTLPPTLAL